MRKYSKLFSIVMLVVFLVTALFGFTTMNHGMHDSRVGCTIPYFDTINCPEQSSGLSMFTHHMDAYQSFARTAGVSGMIFLLTLIVGVFVALYSVSVLTQIYDLSAAPVRFESRTYADVLARSDNRHWLSHLNNSPSRA